MLKNIFILTATFGSVCALGGPAKTRAPASSIVELCTPTAQKAAVKKASESMENCRAGETNGKATDANEVGYLVFVSCPTSAEDTSMYGFRVKTKLAFGTGNGKAVCFASSVDPITAPSEAVH